MISAVLFGALAGTGVLPFSRAQFEATIERGGVGVKPSLKAFGAGVRARAGTPAADGAVQLAARADGTRRSAGRRRDRAPAQPRDPQVRALLERVQRDFPAAAQPCCSKACAA